MPGFIVTEGNRNNVTFTNTPKCLGHQYTTMARKLEAPKMNFKKQFELRLHSKDLEEDYFPVGCWTGNILRAMSHYEAVQFTEKCRENTKTSMEAPIEWIESLIEEEIENQARPFQALQSVHTFKHECAVLGCANAPCEQNDKTLVFGQKKVELMELLVERFTNDLDQIVLDPFMGSGEVCLFVEHHLNNTTLVRIAGVTPVFFMQEPRASERFGWGAPSSESN